MDKSFDTDSQVIPPAGYQLISSPATPRKLSDLMKEASQRNPALPPKGYVLDRDLKLLDAIRRKNVPTSGSISAAPIPSRVEQLRQSIANSAIGHSVESTLPKLADALNLHPTETVSSPTFEQHKEQLLAPEYAAPVAGEVLNAISLPGTKPIHDRTSQEQLEGVLRGVGGLTSAPNMATMAGTAIGVGLTAGVINPASAQLLSRLVSGGFTLDMLHGLYNQNKAYKQAVDSGNLSEAHRIQGEMGVTGVMAALTAHHALTSHPFTPVDETPSRERTNVLHRNTAGEVRQAQGQTPTVWLSPDAWHHFMGALYPEEDAAATHGINLPANEHLKSFANDPQLAAANPMFGQVQELLGKAHEGAGEGGSVAIGKNRPSIQANVNVMREELNHTWQRSLTGQITNHLPVDAFSRMYQAIPSGMYDHLLEHGYSGYNSPEMVTEAAAKLMGGRPERFGVDKDEAVDFLDKYFKEVSDHHGANALQELHHVRGIAADAKARAIEEHGRTGAGQDNGTVSGVGKGGQGGAGEGVPEPAFNREKVKDEADKFQSALSVPVKDWEGIEVPSVNVDVKFPPPKEMEAAWRDASQNQELHQQFKRTGISGFSIEEPYKFGLSEQGNIDPKTGKIAINAAASNPAQTLAHEVAHDIYRRLTPENRATIDRYVKSATHIYPEHTGGLEERIVDHFADEIAHPMSASAPPSIRKIFFESPLEQRPAAESAKAELAPPEPKRPIFGTWSDVAKNGGSLRTGDDIRGLVAKDGDFPLVLKDTYGARHVVPASVAADVLDSPAHNYVREVFMAKDHDYDSPTPRLEQDLANARKMLAANKFMGTEFVDGKMIQEATGPTLTDSYRKELLDKIAKGEKILADRKAGVPHKAIPVVPTDTVRTQTSGARMLTDAIKTFGNRDRLAQEYKNSELPAETSPEMRKSVTEEGVPLFNREQVKTPEFKEWFGDSKVVDEKGEPLVLYHGTPADFTQFGGPLMYFSNDPNYTEYFSGRGASEAGQHPKTIPAYVKMENPVDARPFGLNKISEDDFLQAIGAPKRSPAETGKSAILSGYRDERPFWSWLRHWEDKVPGFLKEKGYDGVIQEENLGDKKTTAWVAISPSQIKSAIGNRGTFDPADPNILRNRENPSATGGTDNPEQTKGESAEAPPAVDNTDKHPLTHVARQDAPPEVQQWDKDQAAKWLGNKPVLQIVSQKDEELDPSALKTTQPWAGQHKLSQFEKLDPSTAPPISVVRTSDGDWIVDGVHRATRAAKDGQKVKAIVYSVKMPSEAPAAPRTTVIPTQGGTFIAAAPVQQTVVPRVQVRVLPLAQVKSLAANMNPSPQRQVHSVRELMKMAKSRIIP